MVTINYDNGTKQTFAFDADAVPLLPPVASPFGAVYHNVLGELQGLIVRLVAIESDGRNTPAVRKAAANIRTVTARAMDRLTTADYLRGYHREPDEHLAMLREDQREIFKTRDAAYGLLAGQSSPLRN